jgi:hypothetical protein
MPPHAPMNMEDLSLVWTALGWMFSGPENGERLQWVRS